MIYAWSYKHCTPLFSFYVFFFHDEMYYMYWTSLIVFYAFYQLHYTLCIWLGKLYCIPSIEFYSQYLLYSLHCIIVSYALYNMHRIICVLFYVLSFSFIYSVVNGIFENNNYNTVLNFCHHFLLGILITDIPEFQNLILQTNRFSENPSLSLPFISKMFDLL